MFLDFLYLLGIQSVRVCKRVKRRAVIFFRPIRNFLVALYRRYLSSWIERICFDLISLRGSILREAERFRSAKKEGRRRPPVELVHFAKKGANNHRRLVCGVLNVVVPKSEAKRS